MLNVVANAMIYFAPRVVSDNTECSSKRLWTVCHYRGHCCSMDHNTLECYPRPFVQNYIQIRALVLTRKYLKFFHFGYHIMDLKSLNKFIRRTSEDITVKFVEISPCHRFRR